MMLLYRIVTCVCICSACQSIHTSVETELVPYTTLLNEIIFKNSAIISFHFMNTHKKKETRTI